MRARAKASEQTTRTRNIYAAMTRRAFDERGMKQLPFTLEEFRAWFQQRLAGGVCYYCGCVLKVKTLTPDHEESIARGGSFEMSNLVASCKPCNFQKGALNGSTFIGLLNWLGEHCDSVEAADVKRRLTIGGKWSFGK